MNHYYEDVDINSRNFRFSSPPPNMVNNNLGNQLYNNIHQPWVPLPGGTNYRPRFPPVPRIPNYTRPADNVYNFAAHPQPNNYRRFPNRFKYNRNNNYHSNRPDGGTQNLKIAFDRFLNNLHVNPFESGQYKSKPGPGVKEQWQSKPNESSKPVLENKQESIKKSALAAKLKKSLENFQKDASKKKINLSIINNSDISKTDTCAKLPEIHPHFQWDLPLTVEDLKAIGRCPSGSAPDEPADDNDSVNIIERQAYVQDTGSSSESPVEISPDIICIKHSRKRKSSESLGTEVKRQKSYMRRRHRSASPDLCMKSSSGNVIVDDQLQQSSHVTQETLNNSLTALSGTNQKPEDKEKSPQSSTVMQLLGIRRRELDELVNQPRSPRVHFMLGLLMKRHKELLMQRAMRSRISSKESQNQPGSSHRPDFPNSSAITSPDVHNETNTLEGMGASDTIDQLSGILLDSSLEIDISSLPQELIDQLGTFLEMSTDMGSYDEGAGNLDLEEGTYVEPHNSAESIPSAVNDGANPRETLLQDISSDQRNMAGKTKEINVTENNSLCNIQIKKEVDTFDEGETNVMNHCENLVETSVQRMPGNERNALEKSKSSDESARRSFSTSLGGKETPEHCRGGIFGGNRSTSNRECRAMDKNKTSRMDRIFGENMSSSLIRNKRVGVVEKETRNPVFCNTRGALSNRREGNPDVRPPSEDLVGILPERQAVSHPMNQSSHLELESRNSPSSVIARPCFSRTDDSLHLINLREESLRTNALNESTNSFMAEQPCASDVDSDRNDLESNIIDSLWRIDLKILELMEEKKMLYEKLWRSRRERNDSIANHNVFSNHLRVRSPSFLISPNQEASRTQHSTPPPINTPQTSSSSSAPSGNVAHNGSSMVPEKSLHCVSTETTSLVHKESENVLPSTSGDESANTITHNPEISSVSFSNVSEYLTPNASTSSEKELGNVVTSTPTIHTSSASFTTPRYAVEDTSSKVKNTPKRLKKHEYVSLVAKTCNMSENVVSSLISVQPSPPTCGSPSRILQRLSCKEDEKSSKEDEHSDKRRGRTKQSPEKKCSDKLVKTQKVPLDKNQEDNLSTKSGASHSKTVVSVPTGTSSEPAQVRPSDDSIEILYDAKIQLDPSTLRRGEFKGHSESVLAIKVYGKFLFASCSDKCVYCYDLNTHEVIRRFKGHTDTVTCIYAKLIGKNKFELYSGSHDKRLLVYISEVTQFTHCRTASQPIQCMEEGWGSLYIGTKGGMIERYKIGRGDFIKPPILNSKNEIMAMQTCVEGPRKVIIVASRNMPIVVRDAHTGLLLRSINEEQAKNTTYCIFVHYGVVYSGVKNLGITACDYTNGKVLRTYKGCGIIVAVKVSEAKVYAASYDGKIYIYDIQSQMPYCQIKASDKMLLCMEQINNTIYAGSIDGKLKFWRLPQRAT